MTTVSRPGNQAPPASLSREDARILALLVAGLHDHEIGEVVVASEHTVRHHVDSLRERLGASTRAELGAQVQAQALGRLVAGDERQVAAIKAARQAVQTQRGGARGRRGGSGRRPGSTRTARSGRRPAGPEPAENGTDRR